MILFLKKVLQRSITKFLLGNLKSQKYILIVA